MNNKKYKNIIAIDNSTELCSISILYKKKIYNLYKYTKLLNSKYTIILIKKILNKNKIKINKNTFQIIAYNKGPGSITGIRIVYIITKIFKIKFKYIKIIKLNTFKIILKNLNYKFNLYKNITIIIYQNIKKIFIYTINKNYKNKILIISLKKLNKYLKNIKKSTYLIVNKYQTKYKILNIIYKFKIIFKIKNIKIIYPKSKYIILYLKKKLNYFNKNII